MVKDSNRKHCNKQNRMSDTEIITILILFHPGDFRCFSPYYKGDACKRLKQLFSCLVSYNCFVELREEVFHELLIWVQVVSDYQKENYVLIRDISDRTCLICSRFFHSEEARIVAKTEKS